MNNLARIYNNLGQMQEAIELEEKVLEVRKRILGEENSNTLALISNLTSSYSNLD